MFLAGICVIIAVLIIVVIVIYDKYKYDIHCGLKWDKLMTAVKFSKEHFGFPQRNIFGLQNRLHEQCLFAKHNGKSHETLTVKYTLKLC